MLEVNKSAQEKQIKGFFLVGIVNTPADIELSTAELAYTTGNSESNRCFVQMVDGNLWLSGYNEMAGTTSMSTLHHGCLHVTRASALRRCVHGLKSVPCGINEFA